MMSNTKDKVIEDLNARKSEIMPCKHLFYSMQNKPHCMIELKTQRISAAIDADKCKNCNKYEPSAQHNHE